MEIVDLNVLSEDVLNDRDMALTTIAKAIEQYIKRHVSYESYPKYLETSDDYLRLIQNKMHEHAETGAMLILYETQRILYEAQRGSGGKAPGDDI